MRQLLWRLKREDRCKYTIYFTINETLTRSTNFIRAESAERNNVGEQEESIRRDAATIRDICNTLKTPVQNKGTTRNIGTDTVSFLSTIARLDLSQLVVARQAHQTKRAANGVKTRVSPKDVTTSDQPQEQTDRRRLRAQMTDLIRRTGTGLERGVRWKSGTAPGTRSLADVSTLTGNSANAEVVAKERVNKVRCLNLLKDLQPYIDSHRLGQRALNNSTGVV